MDTLLADDWIAYHARTAPDAPAQLDLASGRRYTYAQMNERVGRVAAALSAMGVRRGDRVGFLAMNSTDVFEMALGTWRIGAVSLALNWRLTAPELSFIIGDAAPSVVFYDNAFADLAAEAAQAQSAASAAPARWVATDGMGGASQYEDLLAGAEPLLEKSLEQPLDDQCMLMYSSGTTGRPKGVVITHKMMLFTAVNGMHFAGVNRNAVNLAVMPLFHIGGFSVFGSQIFYVGGFNIIQRAFEPGQTLDAFNDPDLGITHFLGVPAIYNALKVHPKNPETDFSRLTAALAGAEAVPGPLVEWWYQRGIVIQEGYGMTENAASGCVIGKGDIPRMIGSAGKPLPHCRIKIMLEDGTEAPTGSLGEIWLKGPVVTPGYWNRPDANADSFVNGWFRSGDIGRQDEAGYITIEDRLKDMYISGGENVYPAEVENVLYELDQIGEVAVIGVPDERWGEVGCAIVVLREGASLTIQDIRAHCDGRLARFKQPAHILFSEALPRNATGKVLKFQLRASAPAALGLEEPKE